MSQWPVTYTTDLRRFSLKLITTFYRELSVEAKRRKECVQHSFLIKKTTEENHQTVSNWGNGNCSWNDQDLQYCYREDHGNRIDKMGCRNRRPVPVVHLSDLNKHFRLKITKKSEKNVVWQISILHCDIQIVQSEFTVKFASILPCISVWGWCCVKMTFKVTRS